MGYTEEITAYGKDFKQLEDFSRKDEKLCIYGCGINGEVIFDFLRDRGKEIEFFIDKQAENREFEIHGKKVISPDTFVSSNNNESVIVSPDNQIDIINFLKEKGVDEDRIICPFRKIKHKVIMLDDNHQAEVIPFNKTVMPIATVFTILYNTPEDLLKRTIESVLAQTEERFRYLVIDNGSTDNSADIIQNYAKVDNRIKYIRIDKNVPWSYREILTTLRDNIKTEYVAMVDSDDYYEKEFLEKTVLLSKTEKSDMVQVNTLTYGHMGFKYSYCFHFLGENITVNNKEKIDCLLNRIIIPPVWGKLYKSEIFVDLLNMMLSVDDDKERDRKFCLDISWSTYMALKCDRVSLCDDILHIRTWRGGSSEHSDNHSSKWLSSIIWSFGQLRLNAIDYDDSYVFEEAALMWLFSLNREGCSLTDFLEEDLSNIRVQEFMNRPLCDKYKRNSNG